MKKNRRTSCGFPLHDDTSSRHRALEVSKADALLLVDVLQNVRRTRGTNVTFHLLAARCCVDCRALYLVRPRSAVNVGGRGADDENSSNDRGDANGDNGDGGGGGGVGGDDDDFDKDPREDEAGDEDEDGQVADRERIDVNSGGHNGANSGVAASGHSRSTPDHGVAAHVQRGQGKC